MRHLGEQNAGVNDKLLGRSEGPSGKSAFANRLDIGLIRQNITNSTVVTLPDNLQGYHIK